MYVEKYGIELYDYVNKVVDEINFFFVDYVNFF